MSFSTCTNVVYAYTELFIVYHQNYIWYSIAKCATTAWCGELTSNVARQASSYLNVPTQNIKSH